VRLAGRSPVSASTGIFKAQRNGRDAAMQATASVESFWHNRNCVRTTFKRMKYYQLLPSLETQNWVFIRKNSSCDQQALTRT
jgi:hypothetical protein